MGWQTIANAAQTFRVVISYAHEISSSVMSHICQDKMDITAMNHRKVLRQQLQLETPSTIWALENRHENCHAHSLLIFWCHKIMAE